MTLKIEVSIGTLVIDTIQIARVKNTRSGINSYRIIEPIGYMNAEIKHNYDDGYLELMAKVVRFLKEKGYNPQTGKVPWRKKWDENARAGDQRTRKQDHRRS